MVFKVAFLLIVVVVVMQRSIEDLLPNSEDYSNVPAPLRYWEDNVTLEGTLENPNIPYVASLQYIELLGEVEFSEHAAGASRACYQEDDDSKAVDTSHPGQYKHVVFKSPEITKFKIEEPYDKDKRNVKVQFHSTWRTFDALNNTENETIPQEDVIRAILENTIYNVSFKAKVDIKDPKGCSSTEYYPVPNNWCDHSTILYGTRIIKPTWQNNVPDNRCEIQYSDQIQHYIDMWNVGETFKTIRSKCLNVLKYDFDYLTEYVGSKYETLYPSFYDCHKNNNGTNSIDKECYDPRYNLVEFNENGKGKITKLELGQKNGTIVVNVTIEFSKWTADFVKTFAHTFRDCDYRDARLDMKMYIRDIIIIPERGPPWYTSILAILVAIPFVVLCFALFLLSFMRSRIGFRLDVWEWWREQEDKKKEDMENANNTDDMGVDNAGLKS